MKKLLIILSLFACIPITYTDMQTGKIVTCMQCCYPGGHCTINCM